MKSTYYRITGQFLSWATKHHGYLAAAMLAVFFGLGLSAMLGNSAIVDEVAHIPSGYSYLHYGDYRLNPEHPPLIKDLAGLPLQFLNVAFPVDEPAWTTDVNGQWESGWNFIYHLNDNRADTILFWARLPVLLLAVVFGVFLYWFTRRHWGTAVGLLALFFYAFSPNILAHSTLVTTDLGATAFMFLALVTFVRFIRKPSRENFLLLSFALAGVQLAKFSAILIFPWAGLISIFVALSEKKPKELWARLRMYSGRFIGASALSVVWVWIFYFPHTMFMPAAVQDRLIEGSLPDSKLLPVVHFLTNLNNWSIFKPLVQYILGLTMVFGRVAGGNVTYFNGMVTNSSFHGYFPELFTFKTQVALLILFGVGVVVALWQFFGKEPFKPWRRIKDHFSKHVLEWTIGGYAMFYFAVSVAGNLNLGIRHILPVYVPLFVLVAVATVKRMRYLAKTRWRNLAGVVLGALLVWYGGSTIADHPYYLSYFNELIGGPGNDYKYFSDSSVDWGQDLKRLKTYVTAHPEIHHIAVDYFGGGVPAYYFCQRKYDATGALVANASGYDCSSSHYEEWHSQYGKYTGQYIAVSETFLENDRYYSNLNGTEGYAYLRAMKPIAKVGYSIYVYKLY
jgi:hypothetical protein